MKIASAFLTLAFLAAVAGCSGAVRNDSSALPGMNSPAAALVANNGGGQCHGNNPHCQPQLVVPLAFDGTNFTVGHFGSCHHIGLGQAKPYVAPQSGPLTLAGDVSLPATCVPATIPTTQLYIIGAQVGSKHGPGAVTTDGRGNSTWVTIAGPASWSDNPWSFAPASPGLTFTANGKYVFFVAVPPSATPSPGPSTSPEPTDTP